MSEPVHAQLSFMAIECSVYRHPIMRVTLGTTPDGDSVQLRCKHCKGTHAITRRKLEKMWAELRDSMEEASVHQDV